MRAKYSSVVRGREVFTYLHKQGCSLYLERLSSFVINDRIFVVYPFNQTSYDLLTSMLPLN